MVQNNDGFHKLGLHPCKCTSAPRYGAPGLLSLGRALWGTAKQMVPSDMRRVGLVLTLALAVNACTNLFFQPHHFQVLSPERFGLEYEDVTFTSSDGVELHGWFLPAEGPALGTVLQLHGNAENISTHFTSVAWMPAEGFNVFAIDYRGYGASEGVATLEGVQLDIDAAMRTLLARGDVDKNRIVIYGQSLGGALAAYNVPHSP